MVFDVRIEGPTYARACSQILHQMPGLRIIVLSRFAEDDQLAAALCAGTAGYVLRRINGSALVEMIAPVGIR